MLRRPRLLSCSGKCPGQFRSNETLAMKTLDRKLLRELNQSKTQSLAIGLVVASGVAVFVMSLGTLEFLKSSRDAYYDRYRPTT